MGRTCPLSGVERTAGEQSGTTQGFLAFFSFEKPACVNGCVNKRTVVEAEKSKPLAASDLDGPGFFCCVVNVRSGRDKKMTLRLILVVGLLYVVGTAVYYAGWHEPASVASTVAPPEASARAAQDDFAEPKAPVETILFLLNLCGLGLTAYGAFVAAQAVIISGEQAKALSGTYWDGNNALYDALLTQSRSASKGLWCVVVGTGFQVAALAVQFLTHGGIQ
jgi:hypothetical protein